jgi:hypothetical protein
MKTNTAVANGPRETVSVVCWLGTAGPSPEATSMVNSVPKEASWTSNCTGVLRLCVSVCIHAGE